MSGLQLDAVTTDSHSIKAGKFRAAWKVGHESCDLIQIFRVITAPQNCSLEQKLASVQFIAFDNFFKVAFVYACLLLWNTKAISQISIKNFITYVKHSQIHFQTGTLNVRGKREEELEQKQSSRQQSYLTLLTCKNCEKSSRIRVGIRVWEEGHHRQFFQAFVKAITDLPNGIDYVEKYLLWLQHVILRIPSGILVMDSLSHREKSY